MCCTKSHIVRRGQARLDGAIDSQFRAEQQQRTSKMPFKLCLRVIRAIYYPTIMRIICETINICNFMTFSVRRVKCSETKTDKIVLVKRSGYLLVLKM